MPGSVKSKDTLLLGSSMVTASDKGAVVPGKPTLEEQGLVSSAQVHWNLESTDLIEMSVNANMGSFTKHRALVTETGTRTGRSPKDKFIVEGDDSKGHVNWGKVNVSTSLEVFENLKVKVIDYLSAITLLPH